MRYRIEISCLLVCLPLALALYDGPDYESLPLDTIFPGPWESYIKAPYNKSEIVPTSISVEGGGTHPAKGHAIELKRGSLVTLEFPENIAGRVCFEVDALSHDAYVALSYSESAAFVGRLPDATTDRQERDLPLHFPIKHTGVNCLGREYNRGAFKYLTIYIPDEIPKRTSFWHYGISQPEIPKSGWIAQGQKLFNMYKFGEPYVKFAKVWVNCTAFPSNPNGRAYTGYFESSSSLLNRIWYAGAYTLQLSTIDPTEGGALIDVNRNVDHNNSPTGSWYSNYTIANGSVVTTDGAKRDRMVWPGDMSIAVPGIAVSTYDMLAVRNALDTIFDHQYGDGSLPYAGPPMSFGQFSDTYHLHSLLGAYNYVLYSGDLAWLRARWSAYLTALDISIAKVDEFNLLHVSSSADWLRPGMTGHNLEASTILFDVLRKSIEIATWLKAQDASVLVHKWALVSDRLQNGIEKLLYCSSDGLFADNKGARGCNGAEKVLPQDGNSWVLMSKMLTDARALNVSEHLRSRWGKYGAPATEFPNTISPFATSFELLGHCAAGNFDAAVELMELQWGYMLDGPGFTNSTLAEGYRVDGDAQYPAYFSSARNSHAHGWSTGPTTVLMQEILGIKLLSPNGQTWTIEPHLTKWLSHVRGGFATKLGKFEVSISRKKEALTRKNVEVLDIQTPKGTVGHIVWGQQTKIFEGGRLRYARVLGPLEGMEWMQMRADDETNEFVRDDDWVRPDETERQPGVVDWTELEKNYVVNQEGVKRWDLRGVGEVDWPAKEDL